MQERDAKLFQKPQVNLAFPTAMRMWVVFFCACAAVIQSAWTDHASSLEIAAVVLGSVILLELLVNNQSRLQGGNSGPRISEGSISDGSAAASALILTLLLPNTIHPVYAGLGAVFAMAVIKHSFGGLGSNWINPALGGWLFVRFSWPGAFEKALEGSPLGIFGVSGGGVSLAGTQSHLDTVVSSFLNGTIFSFTGAGLPAGYVDLFFSTAPGIIADRGIFVLLLGTIAVLAFRVSRSWIPAVFLGVYTLLVRIFGALGSGGALGHGDILFGLFSGGVIAAAFLLAADPATGAKSTPGMLVVVVLEAVLSFIFRYLGGEPYGAFFAILLVNTLVPLIRSIEGRHLYSQGIRKAV